jgi:hypothetical protein
MNFELEESETVEFKKSTTKLREGIVSMTAILNKHQGGGALLWHQG